MLWNVVYEFFVKYIFGGYYLREQYPSIFGTLYSNNDGDYVYDLTTSDILVGSFTRMDGSEPLPMLLGNYLSLIATIISMVAIVLICCALIKKIYNMCAHIIG